MSTTTLNLDENLYSYLLQVSLRDSDLQRRMRDDNQNLEMGRMQTAADQAQFMALLVKLIHAQRILEIGTFTGYSSLAMALALPENGRLTACDVSEEWTSIARHYWREAGVEDKIQLILAPALQTLDQLLEQGGGGDFDLAFIDADKTGYDAYYERCLRLVRPGGLILVDNVLWGGSVVDEQDQTEDTRAIRAFNLKLKQDKRIDISLVPIGDGLTMARIVD